MNNSQQRQASPALIQWLLLCFGLLALGGAMGGNLLQERAHINVTERERLLVLTHIVQQITDKNLSALNAVLVELSRDWSQGNVIRDTNHRLETLNEALVGVRTLAIFDGQGVIQASNRPVLLGKEFKHRDYFRIVRENPVSDMLYVSPPFVSSLGVNIMTLSRMIPGPQGEFAGVVTASLDPEFFIPLLKSVLFAPDMRATIAHGSGHLFLMVPKRPGVVDENLAKPGSFFTRHRDSGLESSVMLGISAATGDELLLAARTIRPAELKMNIPLGVGISRDPSIIFDDWRRQVRWQGIFYVVVVLGAVGGLRIFQKRQRFQERQIAEAADALALNERFLSSLIDHLPGVVIYWDQELRCGFTNIAGQEWFGRSKEQMVGTSIMDIMGEELFKMNETSIRAAMRGTPQAFERTLANADGMTSNLLARYVPYNEAGQVKGFFVLVSDVTEFKTTQLELERRVQELDILATTDVLTGIGNRRNFLQRTGEELERSSRYGTPTVCLMLDIDHFKSINDNHGHATGDKVLKAMVDCMRETLRTTDILGRLGGEEFGVLLIQTELSEARNIAERLREILANLCLPTEKGGLCFTVSIGLAEYAVGEDSIEIIMKHADEALYQAKNTGRNRVCCYGDY
jgi:diguanylate cyclase (GGDEF)-like protein/PAS domain S-box-containing protein